MKKNEMFKIFGINTVRKKVLLLSKILGVVLILFYVFTSELPTTNNITFWVWFALMVIVVLGVDILLGRLISKPLNDINDTAERMAKLDFTAHCDLQTSDEFGKLSKNLNLMFANLQETLENLEIANTQLEKDVARERILLTQRKELIDSLSHEMKTPLGIIQAYTEELKDETIETKKQQYLTEIIFATRRMNNLIVSLLDLSALEAGAVKLSSERFDIVELAETVAGRLLIDTANTNYYFNYELPDEKLFILADKHRIEQVLENLIENAKNHVSDTGKLRLTIVHDTNKLRFAVFNQGEPIAKKDFSKIWTKFYRGENSQSSSSSGLGLAIVAQILSMYKVDYGVLNLHNGVEFYFEFPIIS